MDNLEAFQQGLRCGAIEGKGRAAAYVAGEEYDLSYEAARNNVGESPIIHEWARGYRIAYIKAAEGE